MSRKYKFRDNSQLYFVSFATVNWIDVFIRNEYKEVMLDRKIMEQKLDYVHNNPVSAGFVSSPTDWIYSSARDYAGEKGLLDIILLE